MLSFVGLRASAVGGGSSAYIENANVRVGEEFFGPTQTQDVDGRVYLSTNKIASKNAWTYPKMTLKHTSKTLSADTRLINGVAYVAVRAFIGELGGMSVSYKSATRTLHVRGTGLDMEIIDGSNIIYVNGRTLFSITPNVLMSNGAMYAPLSSVAKALSLTPNENSSARTVTLWGTVKPIVSGSLFYREDEVYWLSRIISSESKGEPLIGQIAVGNVVLNRVKSKDYPNSIWGVIFDRKYGVQFSPVLNGTIYDTPSPASVTAAKICLEGYQIAGEGLFFLAPQLATSSWIPRNRPYLFTVGNHDFYS